MCSPSPQKKKMFRKQERGKKSSEKEIYQIWDGRYTLQTNQNSLQTENTKVKRKKFPTNKLLDIYSLPEIQ